MIYKVIITGEYEIEADSEEQAWDEYMHEGSLQEHIDADIREVKE